MVRIDIDENTFIEIDRFYLDKIDVQSAALLKANDSIRWDRPDNDSRISSYKKGLVISLRQKVEGSVTWPEKIRYGTYDKKSGQWQLTSWINSNMHRKTKFTDSEDWFAEYKIYSGE